MPKYRISKIVTAKNIGQTLKAEKTADIHDIQTLEEKEEEGSANTHAIGFEIRPDWMNDDYSTEHGI